MPLSPWLVNIIIQNGILKTVKTGDSVDIGNGKSLVFVEMRMLHWPDSYGNLYDWRQYFVL